MSSGYFHPDSDFYRKVLKTDPPKTTSHVTEDDVMRNMTKLTPNSWHLEGNQLIGMTQVGKLVQTIPSGYICKGSDSAGLPILEKVVLS